MWKIIFVVSFCLTAINSYKILVLFPAASRSHHNLGSALAQGLAEAGHDVTIVSPFEDKYVPKKGSYREIIIKGYLEKQVELAKQMDMFKLDSVSFKAKINIMLTFKKELVHNLFSDEEFQKLLHSNATFDATILEHFVSDAVKSLPAHFKSHQILLSPMSGSSTIDDLVGNPTLPSFAPNLILSYPSNMDFWQRTVNTLVTVIARLYLRFYVIPTQNSILKQYLPDAVDLHDAMYNASIILLNSHTTISHPLNKVPNMIDVAGYHLKSPGKLSKSLQDYLDNAEDGVVYFNMGSVAQSKDMPVEKRNLIMRSLGSLKQDVLWKWEEDDLPNQPKNIRIEKWLPQESILAHPNVKLFITHGGFLSTIETTHYGVPIVALPIFGDQYSNAKQVALMGFGKFISYHDVTEDQLIEVIKEVLHNPKYTETAKQKSALFQDREVSPMLTAIYWVEYVIRHNGAKHLRVVGLDLPWYKYYLLDVITFLLLISAVSLYITVKFLRWLCRSCQNTSLNKVKMS